MKNPSYPLIISGATLIFLASSSAAQAKSLPESEELSESRQSELELLLEAAQATPVISELTFEEDRESLSLKTAFDTSQVKTPSLLAQTPLPPTNFSPAPAGVMIPQPEITVQDNGTPDLLQPQTPVAPTLPRAIAPPVGDMAISNIDASGDSIDLGTSIIVPRLVLRQAPAREVLAVLARYAGLNLVFTDTPAAGGGNGDQAVTAEPTVSLDLENEPVQEVFNSVLMISGLKANRRGRTIFVGAQLPQGARNLISRTLRLNQVKSFNAGIFLAAQGAEFQRLVTLTEDIVDPLTQRVIGRREIPSQLEPLTVDQGDGATGALLLSGLMVSADDRLNSITLIGEPRQVTVATSLLTQLDARRRQVAVNVKVVDVNLLNIQDFNSSFSFGFDDGFFLQDQGSAILNFGQVNPPSAANTLGGAFLPTVVPFLDTITGNTAAELAPFFDIQQRAPFGNTTLGFNDFTGTQSPYARPNFGTFQNPFQPGLSDVNVDPETGQVEFEFSPPGLFQYPQKFLLTLQSQIQSGNAKILTDPTLVVQEGQQATVKLTQKVIESVNTVVDPLSGVRTTTPVLADSGLTLSISIDKIDDNGFVSLSVSPTIAAPGDTQVFDSGDGARNTLTLLNRRELTSGVIRLRDSQTLIVSGIIQESDRTTVSKVPVLGDIPILGALFRSTNTDTERQEVIILLTPQILDDTPRSRFGFNYSPGGEASEILRNQGFPVPGQP